MRAFAAVVALLIALVHSGAAWAHASLVRAEPADGAVVTEAPTTLRLTFNEPVSPLVMRLIAPDGSVTMPRASAENVTVTVTPAQLQRGTHTLSWRVISADGHPVGGSLTFSVGEASARPSATLPAGSPEVRAAFWAAKLVIYVAIFMGIGGALVRAWMCEIQVGPNAAGIPSVHSRESGNPAPADPPPLAGAGKDGALGPRFRGNERKAKMPWLDGAVMSMLAAGLVATPLSVGLQGLDALDLRLSDLAQHSVWQAGFQTSYGATALVLSMALLASLFSLNAAHIAARALSFAAIALAGLALALSGHASNAMPQALTRPAVFVHVVCVAFWIGALLPLAASVRRGDSRPLTRFTRLIPYPLAALLLSGVILAVAQLDRLDALWTTRYGTVLSCKLLAVALLFTLAVANRYHLAPRYRSQAAAAARPLAGTISAEICIAIAIFALVAGWRFTPPPRALAAAEPISVHLHGARAMAQLTVTPVRARSPRVQLEVLDDAFSALAVKEVTLTLANPAAGIEPVRRAAIGSDGVQWRIEDLRIPLPGRWTVRVELLIDDFEKVVLEDEVELPRLP